MLKNVTGDILLSEASTIAHGVSPDDDFNQGLAMALRERWPAMYKDFRHHAHVNGPKPGELWVWAAPEGHRLAALFTQEDVATHGRRHAKATIEHVNHALRALRKWVETEGVPSLAIPRLASGVGGLDWEEVEPIVERRLGDLSIPVYVYSSYQPGVQAAER